MEVSQEEWKAWADHPVTRELVRALRAQAQRVKDDWSRGTFTHADPLTTAMMNATAIETTRVLEQVSELDYELLEGERDE